MTIRLYRPRIRMLFPCSILTSLATLACYAALLLQTWLLAALSLLAACVAVLVYLEWLNFWIEVSINHQTLAIQGFKMHMGSITHYTRLVQLSPVVAVDLVQPWYWRLMNCADLSLHCADGATVSLGPCGPGALLLAKLIYASDSLDPWPWLDD